MNIFLFTGLSASGKTIISKKLSDRQEIPRLDIHKVIHELAEGYSRGRDWIEEVGEEKALKEANKELLMRVKREVDSNINALIVDEVINMNMVKRLERLGETHIIYIKANRHDRNHFMRWRLRTDDKSEAKKELRYIDSRKEKMGIREVIENREIEIINTGDPEIVYSNLEQELHSRGLLEGNRVGIERI